MKSIVVVEVVVSVEFVGQVYARVVVAELEWVVVVEPAELVVVVCAEVEAVDMVVAPVAVVVLCDEEDAAVVDDDEGVLDEDGDEPLVTTK